MFFLSLVLFAAAATGQSAFDWGWQDLHPTRAERIEGFYPAAIRQDSRGTVYQKLIMAYRVHVSPVQARHCPFLPSCSAFTLYAMNKYGVLAGFIMGIDRMYLRENAEVSRRIHYLALVNSKGETKVYDPPEADFIFGRYDWRITHPLYDLRRLDALRESGDSPDGRGAANSGRPADGRGR
jgi:hypothetical protein